MSMSYFVKFTLLLRTCVPVSMHISFNLPFHRAAANCNSLLLASLSHVNFSCLSQRLSFSGSTDYRFNLQNSDSLSNDRSREFRIKTHEDIALSASFTGRYQAEEGKGHPHDLNEAEEQTKLQLKTSVIEVNMEQKRFCNDQEEFQSYLPETLVCDS